MKQKSFVLFPVLCRKKPSIFHQGELSGNVDFRCTIATVREVYKIKENMMEIMEERKKKHMEDDYGIQECWGKMIDILCIDVQQTVTYLENCTPEELYYISEVFEDISERLQSKTFIECLRKLDKKFPELKMTKDINMAESYI